MKKIKLLVFSFILFFCFYGKTSFKADAAVSKKVLFQDEYCDIDTFKILNKGYYVFAAYNELDPDLFLGDYNLYIKSGEKSLTTDDFIRYLPFDKTYLPQLNEIMVSIKEKVHEDMIEQGVALLTVNTTAVFYTGNSTVEHAECEYLEYDSLTKDPTIAGGMTHVVNVDNKISLKEIESRYSATDNVDGDISHNLRFESNYRENASPIGTYFIVASAFDNEGNFSWAVDLIIVKDFVCPIVELEEKEIEKEVHTPFSSIDAKKYFTFSDNNTPLEELKIVYEEDYNDQYNIIGNYFISAYAIDKDNNKSKTETLKIKIIDKIPPSILLKGEETNKIIADHVLTDAEIKSLMIVHDNYDSISNSMINIVENTCNGEQGKEYQIKVEVFDQSGNKGENIFQYYLTDTTSPIICVKNVLYIEAGKEYTNEQIIAMLKEANIINFDSSISNISTSFLSTYQGEDTYELIFEEKLIDGTIKTGSIQLKFFLTQEANKSSIEKNNYWYLCFLLLLFPVVYALIWMIRRKRKCGC